MATESPVTNWGTVADWAVATATFLAVLVALFKDEVAQWWRRPILAVSVSLEPPYCHKTILRYTVQRTALTFAQAQCYYFRLWIENQGKTRATQVQVFAARLFRRAADGSFQHDVHFLPMNLRWAHAHSRGPEGGPEVYADGISPKMGKHCDLGHVIDPANRTECGENIEGVSPTSPLFALDLEFPPNTGSHLLAPGTYRLELQIAAANARPVTKLLEITIAGSWSDDERIMFRDGIGLRVI
ncbi:MAG: hypothetical protein HY323_18815 [Betaproteobacteria bacterium]|nr:hypothetical protein [Betaproteobacteria bacterium]